MNPKMLWHAGYGSPRRMTEGRFRGAPGAGRDEEKTMMRVFLTVCCSVLCCTMLAAQAEETRVSPGVGTLAAAITAAAPGDTLVLEEGGYTGDATVNKSLVIRARARAVIAMLDLTLTVTAPDAEVTLQGLSFGRSLVLTQAQSVRILENTFVGGADIESAEYKTADGDGTLYVIGNRLLAGSSINKTAADNAYIAGNFVENGRIVIGASAWVVGNDVTFVGTSCCSNSVSRSAITVDGVAGTAARVLGNRARCFSGANCYGIGLNGVALSIVAGNLIESEAVSALGSGILLVGTGNHEIRNNTIYADTDPISGILGIGFTGSATIVGNIIRGRYTDSVKAITGAGVLRPTQNVCYSARQTSFRSATAGACQTSYGNHWQDPKLQDLVDFRPAADSPAIDAGPEDFAYADLDRTRNDIGAYGGPWAIGQYDAQRDPTNFGPYVYPLFKGGVAGGELEIEAIGVARLR